MKFGLVTGVALAAALLSAVASSGAQETDSEINDVLCGDERLIGENLPPIVDDEDERCGAGHPVFLKTVAGLRLTPYATANCRVARALADWVENSAGPKAETMLGSPVEVIHIASSYVCRPRNNQPGARLSEHGLANAFDIMGFTLANEERVTVLDGWEDMTHGPYLLELWRDACGPFGTVLGPEANALHRDHFHFDGAKRRNPYCE